MNLNDTIICRSKSELLRNHTNGIQEISSFQVCLNALISFSVPPQQLNNNGILIGTVSIPPNPQPTRGIRSRHHHSPLAICLEKAATVSFPLAFFFIHYSQLFSPPHYQLNCYSALPQLTRGIRSRRHHLLLVSWWRRWWRWVCLCFYFPPHHSKFFSRQLFPIKLLFSWPCRPPSLSQWRDQGPTAVIPACDLLAPICIHRGANGELAYHF